MYYIFYSIFWEKHPFYKYPRLKTGWNMFLDNQRTGQSISWISQLIKYNLEHKNTQFPWAINT